MPETACVFEVGLTPRPAWLMSNESKKSRNRISRDTAPVAAVLTHVSNSIAASINDVSLVSYTNILECLRQHIHIYDFINGLVVLAF